MPKRIRNFDMYKKGTKVCIYHEGMFYLFSDRMVRNFPEHVKMRLKCVSDSKFKLKAQDKGFITKTFKYKGNLESLCK